MRGRREQAPIFSGSMGKIPLLNSLWLGGEAFFCPRSWRSNFTFAIGNLTVVHLKIGTQLREWNQPYRSAFARAIASATSLEYLHLRFTPDVTAADTIEEWLNEVWIPIGIEWPPLFELLVSSTYDRIASNTMKIFLGPFKKALRELLLGLMTLDGSWEDVLTMSRDEFSLRNISLDFCEQQPGQLLLARICEERRPLCKDDLALLQHRGQDMKQWLNCATPRLVALTKEEHEQLELDNTLDFHTRIKPLILG